MPEEKGEVWQRGPLENIPGLLQPVAHALLQAREELKELTDNFPESLLWTRPAGVASPAFHLQHLTGVLDRLFTYAKGKQLSETQLHSLAIEGNQSQTARGLRELVELFNARVDSAIDELSKIDISTLT
ncbi:MAG: DinB family protein, partial [Ginsengibacter sp.]